ncbi:outer membrane receptor protein involved in Fe transport [Larkinella arboricola]|uniref:Outer membrane receptor protein involved in Fe transport n=1 Tax=Larkinella arboricola TaxID=643671 RepID=A0A327WV50_LARAB|nr:TonB-dependent receptor [Larkinella arboricola]RAJ95937.1 outer membrane receptor protein involved in Fe transport [Larkinella arboricola]
MQSKLLTHLYTFLLLFLLSGAVYAQSVRLLGTLTDAETKTPLVGASVVIKDQLSGTVTDAAGQFSILTNRRGPWTLVISMVGYEKGQIPVANADQPLAVTLKASTQVLQDVVVAASRVEENILQAPVSIEKMDGRAIRETPSASFYEGINNLKGVDMVTSGLTYKQINTRGFASTGNSRFLQLIDGIDNQPAGFGFSVGNMFGLSDLDAESVELVPGAASALYGPAAFNGALLMHSKDPFQYQGLSAQAKVGVNHLNDPNTGAALYHDYAVRYARAFKNKLAFKLNVSYMRGLDWFATDYTDVDATTPNELKGRNNPAYNGLNVYGDEVNRTITGIGKVARTGYEERALTDYNVYSLKLNGALHYRITPNLEAIYSYNYAKGIANYTGSNRFSVNGFSLLQHRIELRGANFFVRWYTNQEDSHDSYNTRSLGQQINRTWVRDLNGNAVPANQADEMWFTRYTTAYEGKAPGVTASNHGAARAFADQGRYLPGSPEFEREKTRLEGIQGLAGAGIMSQTKMHHTDAQYNFSSALEKAGLSKTEVLAGGNFRQYSLFTNGTLFDDRGGRILYYEYGVFLQASQRLFADKLKLTVSGRYDKNQNFAGYFTPRASLVFSPTQAHNFRASFQTGFRNPTPSDQFIKLNVGPITILGGAPSNSAGMNVYENSINSPTVGGFVNGFLADMQAGKTPQQAVMANKDKLEKSNVAYIKPEKVQSFEVGYRGLLNNRVAFDANYYFGEYQNFILNQVVIRPDSPVLGSDGQINPAAAQDILNSKYQVFQLYTNASDRVTAQGATLGLTYFVPGGYTIGGNGTWSAFDLKGANPNNIPAFNTPRYKTNVTVGNRNIGKNIGFNVAWHWQDSFDWVGSFNDLRPGRIQAYHLLDAQVTYRLPALKTALKVGASNLTNRYIVQAYGSPAVGGLYYVSLTFDQNMR